MRIAFWGAVLTAAATGVAAAAGSDAPGAEDERRIGVDIAYTADIWRVPVGALSNDTVWLSNLVVSVNRSLGPGTVFASVLHNNAATLTGNLVDDAQFISNIDNGRAFRFFELHYNVDVAAGAGNFQVGLLDLNADFDSIDTAGLFLSSSHGIGPEFSFTGENGPSIFPATALGARYIHSFSDSGDLRIGVFDAVPDNLDFDAFDGVRLDQGALLIAEANAYRAERFRFAAGLWGYTSAFETLTDPVERRRGNAGGYLLAEAALQDGVAGWVRMGAAFQTRVNAISSYVGGGLVKAGLFGRPDDQVGVAIGHARVGRAVPGGVPETVFELTATAQITPWLRLQPDLQYILNPGFEGGADDALAVGLRGEIGFSF